MSQLRLPSVPIRTDYVKFFGGIDLETPVLSLRPGYALDAMNYEPGAFGGYQRIDGFERFDGRPAPSAATYHYAEVSISLAIAVGNTITGATSAATGVVIRVDAGAIAITKLTGTFTAGETLNVAGNPVATLSQAFTPRSYRTGLDDAIALAAAADNYRADILAVPGAGAILGVNVYKGVVYAFRNNADNSMAEMYKATNAGWTKVVFGSELAFAQIAGQTTEIKDGDTITGNTSGATAVVRRAVLQSGSWGGSSAKGRLIIDSITGTFVNESIKVGATAVSNTTGNATPIVLQPGGRFEFANTNFAGGTETYRMYGCDGKNRAFEFDGEIFVPITTGMTDDRPKFICAHKKALWLAFKGSLQKSGDGNPYTWTVLTGATEIGMGEEITGLAVQPGEVMAVFTRNSTGQLVGSTTNSFKLDTIAPEVGAIAYTVQTIGVAYGLDDRGITQIQRTQAYGNFEAGTVSRLAQKLVDKLRGKAIGSTTYKSRNQYRVYGSDGTGLIMTIDGTKIVGIMPFSLGVNPTCFCSGEDASGRDVVFFGTDTGFVYQADKGSSFDGQAIEAYLRLPFNNINSPRNKKRYRKAVLEISAIGYSAIRFQPEFTYGDPDIGTHRLQTGEIIGAGGYFDADSWETIFWDARLVSSPEFSIEGSGTNMALLFYSKSAIDLSHTVQGMLIHYTPRKLMR